MKFPKIRKRTFPQIPWKRCTDKIFKVVSEKSLHGAKMYSIVSRVRFQFVLLKHCTSAHSGAGVCIWNSDRGASASSRCRDIRSGCHKCGLREYSLPVLVLERSRFRRCHRILNSYDTRKLGFRSPVARHRKSRRNFLWILYLLDIPPLRSCLEDVILKCNRERKRRRQLMYIMRLRPLY